MNMFINTEIRKHLKINNLQNDTQYVNMIRYKATRSQAALDFITIISILIKHKQCKVFVLGECSMFDQI